MKKRLLIALIVVLALAATASLVWANADGLVSYWPFDGSADDAVNGNHGTVVGATYVSGRFGQALYFDGTGGYVDFGDIFHFGSGESFTAQCWVNTTQAPANRVEILGVYPGPTYPSPNQFWAVFMEPGGYPSFWLRVNNGAVTTYKYSTKAINDGVWHYIAAVKDVVAGQMFLYVDDEMVSTAFTDGATANNYTFRVGNGHWNRYYNGTIDECGIWNRALSADEVAALSVGVGSVGWLPPLALDDWTLNENATLPIKFQLYGAYGNPLCTDLMPTLKVDGQSLDVRFDESGCYYIANFRPGAPATGLTGTVYVDSVEVGISRPFDIVEAGTPNGRGRSK